MEDFEVLFLLRGFYKLKFNFIDSIGILDLIILRCVEFNYVKIYK